jgi:hypothetical protein
MDYITLATGTCARERVFHVPRATSGCTGQEDSKTSSQIKYRQEISMLKKYRAASTVAAATLVALILLGSVPLPRAEASRGHFAAIAYSEQTHRYGYVYGYTCLPDARRDAVHNANACDAQVVVSAENGWVALALGDDGAYGYGWSTCSRAEAERIALQNCGQHGCHPHIVCWASSG